MTLDERVFAAVNGGWTSPVLDWWAALVRASEIWVLPAVVALVLAFWRGSPRVKAAAILVLLVFIVGDSLVVRTGKLVFRRQRPDEVLTVRSVRLAPAKPRILGIFQPLSIRQAEPGPKPRSGRSFPSGHAWNAFGVATVLFACWRRWGWLAYLPAAAIAHARIYAGLHWPSDVLLSALLSVPVSFLLALGLDRAWRRLHPWMASRWSWTRSLATLLPPRESAEG